MEREDIERCLHRTKCLFLDKDAYLLDARVNERAITHKFAEHLQYVIGSSWNVDCEYNRDGLDQKKLITELKNIVGEDRKVDEDKTCTVYPDIIVHKRGSEGPNLLVIEAKKDATDSERGKDKEKLLKIQQHYSYSFGVFVNFITNPTPKIEIEFVLEYGSSGTP